MFFENIDKDLV